MAQETYVVKYIFQGTPLSAQHLTRRSGPFFACWGIFRTRALSVVDLVGAFAAKFGISRTRRRSCYGGGSPFRKCLLIGLPGRALVAIGAVIGRPWLWRLPASPWQGSAKAVPDAARPNQSPPISVPRRDAEGLRAERSRPALGLRPCLGGQMHCLPCSAKRTRGRRLHGRPGGSP